MDILVIAGSVMAFALLVYIIMPTLSMPKPNLPPGRFGWPLVGEMPQLLASIWAKGFESFLEDRNKRFGNIFKLSVFGRSVAILYSAQGNRFLFNTDHVQNYYPHSVMNMFGSSLLSKTGDEARQVRKMLMTFLKAQAMQKFVGTVDCIVSEEVKSYWSGKQQVEAFHLIKHGMFAVACSLFVSMRDEVQQRELYILFKRVVEGIVQIPLDFPGTPYHRGLAARKQIHKVLQKVIDKRREDLLNGSASMEQDLLSFLLCNADDHGQIMADHEIIDNMMVLLVGGHDTNVVTLTFLLRNLALHPHCYTQVLQEHLQIMREMEGRQELKWDDVHKMKYSWRAAQETLRLQPAAAGSLRMSSEDISYDGFLIPKGWKLAWAAYSTHKKAEYFPDPEKFDPGRFEGSGPEPYTFVPFGGGRRMCPGNEYARMIILVFLHNIVKNFTWELMDANENISANPLPIPEQGMPLRLFPRSQDPNV
ncbi:hypothetical protein SUGI_1190660 [Cryptomeria japonica]|uniref:cytochrome P450 716B1 n=1 Tax=Cryptomeria japonica TaxID=3369 RepID=UPI0024147131|nr:cytochrome P450 716B1 [Cryptomeria japonica]GLJ55450.1 hypothetical protein SUGI_1190660 [Cryptomeria japonica]